jgi:DNA-directed RNA polymerase specialized sigma24 family protein
MNSSTAVVRTSVPDRALPALVPDDFGDFYAQHYRDIVSLAALIIGDRLPAEDVAQEAFTRLAARWKRVSR